MENKIFAPLVRFENGNLVGDVVGDFITRFLLFDHYTIDSSLMRELVVLVNVFGIDGLCELLKAGHVSIHASAYTIGQMNHKLDNEENPRPSFYRSNQQLILPYNHLAPVIVDITDRKSYISSGFRNINSMGFKPKRIAELKSVILQNLTELPENHEDNVWMKDALSSNLPIVKQALLNSIDDSLLQKINSKEIEYSFKYLEEDILKVETNLSSLLKLNEYEEHKIIEKATLSIGGFYRRLLLMKEYGSIAWFSEEDAKLMDAEVNRVAFRHDSNIQERRLSRVIELTGLPRLSDISKLNTYTLMKMRDSNECREFREWLKTSDAKSDKDIINETKRYSTAFANMFGTFRFRMARFAITSSIGSITTTNPFLGVGIGIADQFILDNLIKRNGPVWFINNELPKLYNPYRQ